MGQTVNNQALDVIFLKISLITASRFFKSFV